MVSNRLLPLIGSCRADFGAPWEPHLGLKVELRTNIEEVEVVRLRKNRMVYNGSSNHYDGNKDGDAINGDLRMDAGARPRRTVSSESEGRKLEGAVTDEIWNREFAEAMKERRNIEGEHGELMEAIKAYATTTGTADEAATLGDNLAVWSRAAQRSLRAAAAGGAKAAACAGPSWRSFPEFRREELVTEASRRRLVDRAGGGSAMVRVWKTVSRWLRDVERWAPRGRTVCTAIVGVSRHIECFLGGGDGLAKAALDSVEEDGRPQILGELNLALAAAEGAEAFDAREAVDLADRLAAEAVRASRRKANEAFTKWIKRSPATGGKAVHRLTNAANTMPSLRLVIPRGPQRGYMVDPIEVAPHHAKQWKDEWPVGDGTFWQQEMASLVRPRATLVTGAADWANEVELNPGTVRRALKTFRSDTAIGADDHDFGDIARLPDSGLWVLCAILRMCLANLALPQQALVNIMTLLGKKSGGSRTIAIMATVCRLQMRLMGGSIAAWDAEVAGPWDSAARGSSPLRAYLARAGY